MAGMFENHEIMAGKEKSVGMIAEMLGSVEIMTEIVRRVRVVVRMD